MAGIQEVKYRAPTQYTDTNGTNRHDNRKNRQTGAVAVAIGLAAITFATRSAARVRKEQALIKTMWANKTTVKGLRRMAEEGKALPDLCLVAGWIKSDGAGVVPLTTRVKPLQSLLGRIDQPSNFFIDVAHAAKRDSKSGDSNNVAVELASKGLNVDDIPDVEDDFTTRKNASAGRGSFVVSELLVTRLGCEATKKTTEGKDGKRSVEIRRKPRQARIIVHHHRQVSDGLHLTGLEGEDAELQLPPYDITRGEAPSTFLTLPDPMQEFKSYFRHIMGSVTIINANKPFTHLSRFIFIDQRSLTDDGNHFSAASYSGPAQVAVSKGPGLAILEPQRSRLPPRSGARRQLAIRQAETALAPAGLGVLDALGSMSPSGWYWDGRGFYDNRPGSWSRWAGAPELISHQEFSARVPVAAELNAMHQEASEYSSTKMREVRDAENCFRVVELGIPAGAEVVVLARPVWQDGPRPIKLVAPIAPNSADVDTAGFQLRILQGHTVDNLFKHRNASLLVYLGFGCMGLFTVKQGVQLIEKSLEISYE